MAREGGWGTGMLHLEKGKGRGRKERGAEMLDKRVGFQINAEEPLNRRGDHLPCITPRMDIRTRL